MLIIQSLLILECIYFFFICYKQPEMMEEKTFNYTKYSFFISVIATSALPLISLYNFSGKTIKVISILLIVISISSCIKSLSALFDTVRIYNKKTKA